MNHHDLALVLAQWAEFDPQALAEAQLDPLLQGLATLVAIRSTSSMQTRSCSSYFRGTVRAIDISLITGASR